jgi:hypothetical protein
MKVNWRHLWQKQPKNLVFLLWTTIYFLGCVIPSIARSQTTIQNYSSEASIDFVPANADPPDRGTPQADLGTGSRGDCLSKENMPPLTRLVGSQQLHLTVDGYPTFWVYLPYSPQEAPEGEFSLQEGDNGLYRTRVPLTATPGIIGIRLPSTVSPLTIGKEYRWYFDINCPTPQTLAGDNAPASVTGLVERIAPPANLESELQTAPTPLEKIKIYAKYGIWYETLTKLIELRQKEAQNSSVEKMWRDLLSDRQVGLENIIKQPIVGNY